jgi:hypothetical protein
MSLPIGKLYLSNKDLDYSYTKYYNELKYRLSVRG